VPIVSISKIQHRYGLQENLPQLSAAELGWALDSRKLYIGNGTLSEGAPNIGNTEILTEYSDILTYDQESYVYKGQAAGYTHITGVDINNPTARTPQSKLDDFASVKDFGAVGDGVTDDTVAINRAMFQLFCVATNTEIRRSLFFPAGVYLVSDIIKIPPYAKLVGEGKNSSIIRRISPTAGRTAALSDNAHAIDANIGNAGATTPRNIEIYAMSFENRTQSTVFSVNASVDCRFESVSFKGYANSAPSGLGSAGIIAALELDSTGVNQTRNLMFEQCDFANNVFGVVADDDMQNIVFNNCNFDRLYKAFKLGENTSGSGNSLVGPQSLRVTNSIFDNIYNTALHVYNIGSIISAFNHYREVGNALAGSGNPAAPVIIFGGNNNSSICDIFDRNDADSAVRSRVEYSSQTVWFVNPGDAVQYGRTRIEPGRAVTLLDASTNANTGISFNASTQKTNLLYYTAERGSNTRHGILKIAASSAGVTISDDYNYDGLDIGVTFSAAVSSGVANLRYTSTGTGSNITMKYRVERLV